MSKALSEGPFSTNHPERDGWIKSDTVLYADANPAITFTSTGIGKTPDTTGVIMGDLTIRGQTLPVTLDATFHNLGENSQSKKQTLDVSATGTLARSDWDMSVFVCPLGNNINIQIEVAAVKAEG